MHVDKEVKGAKCWKLVKKKKEKRKKSQECCRNNGTSAPDICSQETAGSFLLSHLEGKLAK